jgi:hypothetical protein
MVSLAIKKVVAIYVKWFSTASMGALTTVYREA